MGACVACAHRDELAGQPMILRYLARASPNTASNLYGCDALSACQVRFPAVRYLCGTLAFPIAENGG